MASSDCDDDVGTLPILLPSSTSSMAPSDCDLQGPQGLAIVIMGVSGSGKTTVAKMLAEALHCSFIEADDYHSQANKEKMRQGIPLGDEDRMPWLHDLSYAIRRGMAGGATVVLTCSALLKKYRDVLRSGDPNFAMPPAAARNNGGLLVAVDHHHLDEQQQRNNYYDYSECRVKFVCLDAPVAVLMERMERRAAEENHFMSPSLLESQLELLEIDDEESEGIARVDSTLHLQALLDCILSSTLPPTTASYGIAN